MQEKRITGVLHQGPKSLFALSQSLLRPFALCYIDQNSEAADNVPLLIALGSGGQQDVDDIAVLFTN